MSSIAEILKAQKHKTFVGKLRDGIQFTEIKLVLHLSFPSRDKSNCANENEAFDAMVKRANLECKMCVHSKLALFTEAPRGRGNKNTVCLPGIIQI